MGVLFAWILPDDHNLSEEQSMRSRSPKIFLLAAALSVLFPGLAMGAIVWDLTGPGTCTGCSGSNPGNSRKYTVDSTTLTATAWSNTLGNTSTSNSSSATIEAAYLGSYGGGLGVGNVDGSYGDSGEPVTAPQHAMDNDRRYDSILFNFGKEVLLTNVSIGYSYNGDADISVFAYLGSGAPPFTTATTYTYNSLISDTTNWKVTNYSSTSSNGVGPIPITGTEAAQYYLIASYIGYTSGDLTKANDYLKVSGVTAKAVPEPHVLLLLALALTGALTARRTKAKAI